jgi:uncharacterized membrane-anchored protein
MEVLGQGVLQAIIEHLARGHRVLLLRTFLYEIARDRRERTFAVYSLSCSACSLALEICKVFVQGSIAAKGD